MISLLKECLNLQFHTFN